MGEDGSVSVYNVRSGVQMGTLYRHKSLVRILAWWPSTSVVMSVDASNTIFAWKLQQGKPPSWRIDTQLFQCRLDCSSTIIQVLPGEAAGKFIPRLVNQTTSGASSAAKKGFLDTQRSLRFESGFSIHSHRFTSSALMAHMLRFTCGMTGRKLLVFVLTLMSRGYS